QPDASEREGGQTAQDAKHKDGDAHGSVSKANRNSRYYSGPYAAVNKKRTLARSENRHAGFAIRNSVSANVSSTSRTCQLTALRRAYSDVHAAPATARRPANSRRPGCSFPCR